MVQQVRWLWELHEQLKGLNQGLIGERLASQWEWQLSGSPHQSPPCENQFVGTTPSYQGYPPSPPPPPPSLLHQCPQVDYRLDFYGWVIGQGNLMAFVKGEVLGRPYAFNTAIQPSVTRIFELERQLRPLSFQHP